MTNVEKPIPTEEEIGNLLSLIQPQPGSELNQKIKNQPWNRPKYTRFWSASSPMRAAVSIGFILLIFFGISIFSPSLGTLAQRFTHFFSPSNNYPANLPTPLVENSNILEVFKLSIHEAEILAGFEIKTIDEPPDTFHLVGVAYDELREAVIMHFTTSSGGLVLRISQQRVDPDYQGIGPTAIVETVIIGPNKGEFVAGGWMIPEVESGADAIRSPDSVSTVWDANVNLQTLRWSDGEFLYEIILAGSPEQNGYLNKYGLIALANRMQ